MPSDCSDGGGNPGCLTKNNVGWLCGYEQRRNLQPHQALFYGRVRNFVEKVVLEANLFNDLALDSIDALDMVGVLEARLGIEVREEDLKAIRTVRDVVDYICIQGGKRGEA